MRVTWLLLAQILTVSLSPNGSCPLSGLGFHTFKMRTLNWEEAPMTGHTRCDSDPLTTGGSAGWGAKDTAKQIDKPSFGHELLNQLPQSRGHHGDPETAPGPVPGDFDRPGPRGKVTYPTGLKRTPPGIDLNVIDWPRDLGQTFSRFCVPPRLGSRGVTQA